MNPAYTTLICAYIQSAARTYLFTIHFVKCSIASFAFGLSAGVRSVELLMEYVMDCRMNGWLVYILLYNINNKNKAKDHSISF